jgi:hypothetical protein
MNACVTVDTRLAVSRLDVLRHGRQARCGVRRRQVTLQANCIHIGLNQQMGIRPSVREVASTATLGLDHSVLINEGTGCCRVAFSANHELPSGRPQRIFS